MMTNSDVIEQCGNLCLLDRIHLYVNGEKNIFLIASTENSGIFVGSSIL